jgi:hypothetical protein
LLAGNADSANLQNVQAQAKRAVRPSRALLEIGPEKFIKILKDLDSDQYLPLPMNAQ